MPDSKDTSKATFAEKFENFKKRYREGKISTTQMPPLPAGPGPGIGRAVAGAVMNRGRKMLMDRLEKSRQAGAKARNAPKEGSKGRSGTLSERLEATRSRPRTKKESEKFGPLVKRQENLPAKQSRAIVKREENLPAVVREGRREVQNYKPGNRSVAPQGTRTFGDKGQPRIVGLSNKGKLALGAGAAAAAAGLYKAADKPSANVGMREAPRKEAPRDDRASSKSDKAAAFKALQQGMKTPGSPTNPNKAMAKKTGDKSRLAKPEKKFSNFERMKQRQYEKEGVGGRSVTAEGARKRVVEERKYKPLAGLKSASLRSGSSGNSNRSKLAAAFRKKMQGRAK